MRAAGIVTRIAEIVAGFVLAALVGSLVLNLAVLVASASPSDPDNGILALGLVLSVPFVALFVAYAALVPAALAIIVAEVLGLVGWWYFAVAGLATGGLVAWSAASAGAGPAASLLLAGSAAGLAYWLVAGRRSGSGWRRAGSG